MGEGIDRKAFGARVRERRVSLGWSQTELATKSGQSQTNIGWIEQGKAKKPERQALALAEALNTTTDWLLYSKGPKESGPTILTAKQITQIYKDLPTADQIRLSAVLKEYMPAEKPKRPKKAG